MDDGQWSELTAEGLILILEYLPGTWRAISKFVCPAWRRAAQAYESATEGVGVAAIDGEVVCQSCDWLRWAVCKAHLPFSIAETKATEVIAKLGHLDVLDLARDFHMSWEHPTHQWAARRGDIAMLEFILADISIDHGEDKVYPRYSEVGVAAAEAGQMQALQWLLAHDFAWEKERCVAAAAANGHTQVAKWCAQNLPEGPTELRPYFSDMRGDIFRW